MHTESHGTPSREIRLESERGIGDRRGNIPHRNVGDSAEVWRNLFFLASYQVPGTSYAILQYEQNPHRLYFLCLHIPLMACLSMIRAARLYANIHAPTTSTPPQASCATGMYSNYTWYLVHMSISWPLSANAQHLFGIGSYIERKSGK